MVTINIDGEQFELVRLDTLSFGEQRELKRLSGGMSIRQIAEGLEELDADAFFGLVLFSIRRKRPDFKAETLEALNFTKIVSDISDGFAAEAENVVPLSEASTGAASVSGSEMDEPEMHGVPA